ncbi:hypothetical protein BAY61_09720 [Prauserella marina]|uniref:DUF7144 domain-containing protein n=1 Tax=Prauserella marina TaxID=530584 RepID=A0A222VNC2_9PSEU|nr:hypothetical protein [Prauserella marina]ASR35221.1 hypothetical protein BAY61_09720 [Prauserella marina]PWV85011.1 hypothetical protein DES30_1011031 [Prauserella marina]SDC06902.1 hypothetical protein SAMN05421630_101305 [Prauserella marina]
MSHDSSGITTPAALSPTASGITYFAGVILVVNGVLQLLNGFSAIFADNFYLSVNNYLIDIDLTAWGWVHLALGALVLVAGIGVFAARSWAYWTAIALVSLSVFANFLFIPYYPLWSLLIIALDVWVIWALSRSLAART